MAPSAAWLLLIYQLPPQPAYLRVKIWRRLQAMGAVAVKGAVYALPMDEQPQEDFRWLAQEVISGGGEAALCEARFVDEPLTSRCALCSMPHAMPTTT